MPVNLNRDFIRALPTVTKPTLFWDATLKGFGLRLFPSGTGKWVVDYYPADGGARRRMSIGSLTTLTAAQARDKAFKMLGSVALGANPVADVQAARQTQTVTEVLETYIAHARAMRKATTADTYALQAKKWLIPAFGHRRAQAVTRAEVIRLLHTVGASQKVTANRIVTLLGSAYAYAIKNKALPSGTENPAEGIERYEEQGRQRYLSTDEWARLGSALLMEEPKLGPHVAAAIRLLIFTGARLREVLRLEWTEVDFERKVLILPDSKTGQKTIVLSDDALAVLASVPRIGRYVIAGDDPEKPRHDLRKPWARVLKAAGIDGLHIHDLRHSFASVGVGGGHGLPIIGALLGHADSATTQRYAHIAQGPAHTAANSIGQEIACVMGGR